MSKSGQMGTPRGGNTHDPGLLTTVKTTATRRRAIEAEHPEPSSKFSLLVTAMAVPETQVTPPNQQRQNRPSAPGGDTSNPGSTQAPATLEAMATPLGEALQGESAAA